MKFLLDTHIFLWLHFETKKLSPTIWNICCDRNNVLFLSYVSIWEIQIKQQLGKLNLNTDLFQLITSKQQNNELNLLSIEVSHIQQLGVLPAHHRDPFDRLLIAQAQCESMTLISQDSSITQYPVSILK